MDWKGELETGPATIDVKERSSNSPQGGSFRTPTNAPSANRVSALARPGRTAADPGWGEPVAGVSLRLVPDKLAWGVNEILTCKFSLRNQSTNDVGWSAFEETGELEVDGVQHVWRPGTGKDFATPMFAQLNSLMASSSKLDAIGRRTQDLEC